MEDFVKDAKQSLQFQLDWEANRLINKAINELNEMRPDRKLEGGKHVDEGVYEYACKLCDNEFMWLECWGQPKHELCPSCLEKKIMELEKTNKSQTEIDNLQKTTEKLSKENHELRGKNIRLEADVEQLREHNGLPDKLSCDVCGDEFEPLHKEVKVRKAYCGEDCKDKANSEEYQKIKKSPKRKHEAMSKEVRESTAAQVARSEAQQLRRASEKKVGTPKKDCKQCGKLTTRLFCNDECRQDYEKQFKQPMSDFDNPWNCGKCLAAGRLCDLHEKMHNKGKVPRLKPSFTSGV